MTYQDLVEQLKDIPEEYLDQDVDVVSLLRIKVNLFN